MNSRIPKKLVYLILGVSLPLCAKTTRFQELLRPIDFANLYEKNTPMITRKELYSAILGRNLDLKQSRIDVDLARQSRDLVYTQMLIPRTTLSGDWTQTKSVSGSLSSSRDLNLGLSFGATTDIGLAYQLSFPKLELQKNYEGVFNSQTAQSASAGAEGRVSFSLLRGSLFFANGLSRKGAELDVNSADNSLKSVLLTQLSLAENSFYDILLQEMRCKVQERTVEASRALLEDVNEMIRLGDSDQLSKTKVEMQVSQAEVDLLSSRAALNTAKAALRNQLAYDLSEKVEFYPDPRELYTEPKIPKLTLEEAIALAKKKRPDYLNANVSLKKAKIGVSNANSQRMPSLDLTATSSYSATSDNISNAMKNLTKFGEMNYSVGLSFAYQFFDDADKFAFRQANLIFSKADMALTNINNQLWRDLSVLLENIEISRGRLKNSEAARVLAEKKLSSEFQKFKAGESNVRNIVDFNFELANSRITEIGARVDLQKLGVALRTALGEFPEGVESR